MVEDNVNKYWSITQLTKYIKNVLDADWKLGDIWLKGEISNFNHHGSGHMYFKLKDKKAILNCVMFAGNNYKLRFKPQSGMEVLARGNISVFESTGQYQLYVKELLPAGQGDLYLAYEMLKSKLESEGLFSVNEKRELPLIPKGIAVVTSKTGAAVRDIITTISRRNPYIPTYIIPATVQGDLAANSVINALNIVNNHLNKVVDVIIIARGGGSIEDLWAFNDENLARAIFNSKIIVVSGVGHETDFTIADFVADLRAPTPTGAAELVTPSYDELLKRYQMAKGRLIYSAKNVLNKKREQLNRWANVRVLKNPLLLVEQHKQKMDFLTSKLQQAYATSKQNKTHKYKLLCQRLEDLSPLKIMARGYAIVYDAKNTKMIKKINDVSLNEEINIRVCDGIINCNVRGVKDGKKKEIDF